MARSSSQHKRASSVVLLTRLQGNNRPFVMKDTVSGSLQELPEASQAKALLPSRGPFPPSSSSDGRVCLQISGL